MKLKGILALLFAAMTVCSFGQAENPALRKDLERFFAHFDKVMASGNMTAIFDMLAPDYTNVDLDGNHLNRGQFKERVREATAHMKDVKTHTLVKNVRGNGQEAVAWCEEVYTWKERKGNGWVAMKSTSRWAESVRRTSTGWVFYYSQELPTNEPWDFRAGG